MNLWSLISNIIGSNIPKGIKPNKLHKLKIHKNDILFGYNKGIPVGIIEKRYSWIMLFTFGLPNPKNIK